MIPMDTRWIRAKIFPSVQRNEPDQIWKNLFVYFSEDAAPLNNMPTFKHSPHHSAIFWENICLINDVGVRLANLELSPKATLPSEEIEMIRKDFSMLRASLVDEFKKLMLDFALAYLNTEKTPEAMISEWTRLLKRLKRLKLQDSNLAAICYNNRASKYDNIKKYRLAIEDYTKAIAIDGSFAIFYHNRANTFEDIHQYDKGIEDYSKAIEVDPRHISSYFSRGSLFYQQEKYESAMLDFSSIIQIDRSNVFAYARRCYCYEMMRMFISALGDINIVIPEKISETYASRREEIIRILRNKNAEKLL
jgi:tetratricopeptide (TPR) repeat protein